MTSKPGGYTSVSPCPIVRDAGATPRFVGAVSGAALSRVHARAQGGVAHGDGTVRLVSTRDEDRDGPGAVA